MILTIDKQTIIDFVNVEFQLVHNYKSKVILLWSKMAKSEQEVFRLNRKIRELLAFSEKSKFPLHSRPKWTLNIKAHNFCSVNGKQTD